MRPGVDDGTQVSLIRLEMNEVWLHAAGGDEHGVYLSCGAWGTRKKLSPGEMDSYNQVVATFNDDMKPTFA